MLGRNIPNTPERIDATYDDFRRLLAQEKPWKSPMASFEGIAAMLKVTPAFLRKVFQAKNVSLRDALNEKRVEEAVRLLENDATMGLECAALRAGFGSSNTFSTVYRRKYGILPNAKYHRHGSTRV